MNKKVSAVAERGGGGLCQASLPTGSRLRDSKGAEMNGTAHGTAAPQAIGNRDLNLLPA